MFFSKPDSKTFVELIKRPITDLENIQNEMQLLLDSRTAEYVDSSMQVLDDENGKRWVLIMLLFRRL